MKRGVRFTFFTLTFAACITLALLFAKTDDFLIAAVLLITGLAAGYRALVALFGQAVK
jgi:hypothetical protein